MQSNISNIQVNSRGIGIDKFCVANGNLVARKFEIKLFTIKFNFTLLRESWNWKNVHVSTTYIVQFVVETTRVADRIAVLVSSP